MNICPGLKGAFKGIPVFPKLVQNNINLSRKPPRTNKVFTFSCEKMLYFCGALMSLHAVRKSTTMVTFN